MDILLIAYIVGGLIVGLGSGMAIKSAQSKKAMQSKEDELAEKERKTLAQIAEKEKASQEQIKKGKAELERAQASVQAKIKEATATAEKKASDAEAKAKELSAIAEKKVSDAEAKAKESSAIAEKKANELSAKISQLLELQDIAKVEEMRKRSEAEIKKLKAELEDAEDDLDDLKSKHKKELSAKETEIEELENSKKKLLDNIEELKEENKQKQSDIALKQNSISFVTEILEAKTVKIDSKKFSAVQKMVAFISSQLYCQKNTFIENGGVNPQVFEDLCGEKLHTWEVAKKKTWLSGKTTIAFVGEFSAGKTSIVNRILSQDNPNVPLLPVSMKATTAVPTYIAGGTAKTSYNVFTPDNQLKSISESTFKKVTKEVLDEVKGVSSLIQYFVMSYNNQNLKGISVLDTPGFSSGDKEDAERTIEVINECDALFWVFDVNAGTVNKQSIDLIKAHLRKPLYVVINKCDTKAQSEVAKVESLIKKTLKSEGVNVNGFIQFSQNAPLSSIMDAIMSVNTTKAEYNYLDDVKDNIEKAVATIKSEKDKALKLYNKSKKELDKERDSCDDLISELQENAEDLQENAEEAKGIPEPDNHWFKEDDYRMSKDGYKELLEKLDDIVDLADNVDDLADKVDEEFSDYGGCVEETTKAYKEYSDLTAEYNSAKKCLDEFNRLKKNL